MCWVGLTLLMVVGAMYEEERYSHFRYSRNIRHVYSKKKRFMHRISFSS